MAIQIKRNESGNCIEFQGSSNPVYWNACLSGQVDTSDNTKVNVINDIKTAQSGVDQYEFFRIDYTEFRDESNVAFSSAQDVADYITLKGNVSAPTNIAVNYLGAYDATTNTPDITTDVTTFGNAEWYFVIEGGTQVFNSVSYDLNVNDQVRFNHAGQYWDVIRDTAVSVDSLTSSALDQYDHHVDGGYTGTIRNGSSIHPYVDLNTAITASSPNQTILIKGTITVPNSATDAFILPHGLHFYGADESVVQYNTYNEGNGDLFYFAGTDNSQNFSFKNLILKNAGGYGLYIKKTLKVTIEDCTLKNNGWNGLGLSTILAEAGGTLGYDSSSVDLQAFYAGVNASNGGAMRIEECPQLRVIGNEASNNLRGFRMQDCGINGYGFITRNVSSQNIESGLYLAAGSLGGSQNMTVSMNVSSFNSNNGLLAIGGIDNKFSQNEVKGNWNAGFCAWGSANTTLRDSGLYDNNRSALNGIGNTGDAMGSVCISEAYNLLGNIISVNPAYRFIAEILDTQIHYTGLGSNVDKIGLIITTEVGSLADNDKNIIKVDDVGFIGQEYAIDLSQVDISNLRLSLGDNSYQSIGIKAVKPPAGGMYSELPFSNHVMSIPQVDLVSDSLQKTIALHEGVGGNVINIYNKNELQSVIDGSKVNIIQKSSDKIQLRGLTYGNAFIGGVVAGTDLSTMNNAINALLQQTGSATGLAPSITSSLAVSMTQGDTLNYELTADYGVGYEWDLSSVSGIVNIEGNVRKIIGGSALASGTYNIPIKAINYNGEASETIVLTVDEPEISFENTKSIRFNTNDYLSGAALTSNPLYRPSGGSGSSDAWSVSFWFKAGTSSNAEQTILMFGGSDQSGEGRVQFWYDGSSNDKNIRLRYGNNFNYLEFKKPGADLVVGDWNHFLITYDGGSTGASSSNINSYYGRFNFFVNGVYKNTTNSHYNYGWNASIKSEHFNVGRNGSTSNHMRGCLLDELAVWSSDQSSNVNSIYNGGVPFDLSGLPVAPSNWWRMGDGDTYPTIQDNIGNTNLNMNSMTAADIISDAP